MAPAAHGRRHVHRRRAEAATRPFVESDGLAVDRAVRVVPPGGDAVAGEGVGPRRRQLQPPGDALRGVGPGDHRKCEVEVVGGTRQRTDHADVHLGQRARRRRDVPLDRHDAVGRLQRVDAAEVRRDTQRATQVAAQLQRAEAGGHRRRGAAGGAARRAREVPGIVGRAEEVVVGLRVAGIRRQVRLPHHNGAGGAQPGHRHRVLLRDVVGQHRLPRRWCACPPSPGSLSR